MSDGACPNFRDVGEWVNVIAGQAYLPPGRLLRGGKLDLVRDRSEIGSAATIVNLRMGPDRDSFGAAYRQIAISNVMRSTRHATGQFAAG